MITLNKIIVEQDVLVLQEEDAVLDIRPNKLDLTVKGRVYCGIQDFTNKELHIQLEENSHLIIEFLISIENSKNKITISNGENAKLDLHYACTYKGENELIVDSILATSHNENRILIRAVEEEGTLIVKATGSIEHDTKDNVYLEDIKALTNYNYSIKVMPDLIVKTDSVMATHNATISPVDTEELFYLESKGLDKTHATSLIKEGFLKGIVENEELKTGEVK